GSFLTEEFGGRYARADPRVASSAVSSSADAPHTKPLRVLVANERHDRLAEVAALVASLGHEVIAPQIEVSEVGPVTAREHPDVALVGRGERSGQALELSAQSV